MPDKYARGIYSLSLIRKYRVFPAAKTWCGMLLCLCCGYACDNDLTDSGQIIPRDAVQFETGKDVELLYSDSAQVRVMVSGPEMVRYTDRVHPRQEFPSGVKVLFYDKFQKVQSIMTARKAVRMESKGLTVIQDSIVWESVSLERLETSELIWDEKKNIVYSNKFAKITKPGEIIYGYGFETNQEFSNWRIRAIEGQFKADQLDRLQ